MAYTIMTHDEFKAFLKSKDISVDKITETKVYLNFEIPGYSPQIKQPIDLNILPVEPQHSEYEIRADWKENLTGKTLKSNLLDGRKIECIKILRSNLGLGLKELKDLYEYYRDTWVKFLKNKGDTDELSTVPQN